MKFFFQFSLLALAATLTLTSCKKDEDASPSSSSNSFSATINGSGWSSYQASQTGITIPSASVNKSSGTTFIDIDGINTAGERLTIEVAAPTGSEKGTFTNANARITYTKQASVYLSSTSQVVITKFDTVNNKVSGTFTGSATGFTVTNGKFNDVVIE